MVARPAALPRVAVDPGGLHALRDGPAGKDEVDAHAEVLVEHAGAVVPVGEDPLAGPAIADDVMQPKRPKLVKRLPLRAGDGRLADVGVGVEDVVVCRRDVHVAGDDGVLGPGRHDVTKSPKPVELVGVVVRARLPAVRNIDRVDSNAAAGGGDGTRLGMRKPGRPIEPPLDVLELNPRQDRDPVPGRLAMSSDLVAAIRELFPENLSQRIVSQLGLLKANDVRPPLIEPRQEPRNALLERVDVPSREPHGFHGSHPAEPLGGAHPGPYRVKSPSNKEERSMSVIMTMRVGGDPTRFEETVAAEAEAIGRIMDVAKSNGLIAHRWYGSDGEFMAVDEWPDQESFKAFMEQAQPDIGPVMEAAGVTSQPSVTFWRTLDTGDAVGWGA